MLYEIGAGGLKPVSGEGKNSLPIGTVLKMNGYLDPSYVIVKNLGVDTRWGHGATYRAVSLEDSTIRTFEAAFLKFISEKKEHGGIQTYITDEVKLPDEVLELYEKATALAKLEENKKEANGKIREQLVEKGKSIASEKIPAEAQALIVAVHEVDDSDIQTDYFATHDSQLIVLGWSKHKRDLFLEMRKFAGRLPETAHLGTGKGIFEISLVVNHNSEEPGASLWLGGYGTRCEGKYYKGDRMAPHLWNDELPACEKTGHGLPVFTTKAEVEAFVKSLPPKEGCDWLISEEEIEHREKWSMGAGYYLKADSRYSSGWKVEKMPKFGDNWDASVYISLAQKCIL